MKTSSVRWWLEPQSRTGQNRDSKRLSTALHGQHAFLLVCLSSLWLYSARSLSCVVRWPEGTRTLKSMGWRGPRGQAVSLFVLLLSVVVEIIWPCATIGPCATFWAFLLYRSLRPTTMMLCALRPMKIVQRRSNILLRKGPTYKQDHSLVWRI